MRLIYAEWLKLVRRRGTMIWCSLLTIGSVLIANIVLVALHAANSGRHGPAGGADNFRHVAFLLAGLGNVAAILIGAAAGSQDASSGVLRDLVVTGRPRKTLFRVRLPGALAAFLPLLAIGYGLTVLGAFAFAGDLPRPSGDWVGRYAAYMVLITIVDIAIAIGLASFAPSRVVVGVLIAWNAIVSHLLIAIGSLGGARKVIDVAAAEHILPRVDRDNAVPMSTGIALVVLVVWIVIFQRAGEWWMSRRDV